MEGTGGTKLGLLSAAISNRGSPLSGKGLETVVAGVITGTYLTEYQLKALGSDGTEVNEKVKDGNTRGQLHGFDADSEPELEVAVAVHASASLPAVFKPVGMKISPGPTVRFIDGGVMNNTPTSSSIGAERNLGLADQGRPQLKPFSGARP